jgi:YfiH family protein
MLKNNSIFQIKWPGLEQIQAVTTTRKGGVSLSPFASFNLGDHVGDDPLLVAKNRVALQQALQIDQIQWLNQIHGAQVVEIIEHQSVSPDADAAFTKQENIGLAIMTADCLPLFLVDDTGTQIAAIHGGWRSLAANIIKNTVNKFSANSNVKAWLGPCIGPEAFEVGEDVRQQFLKLSPALETAFIRNQNNKYFAHLHHIAKVLLQQEGVDDIDGLNDCTFSLSEQYFSYRRSGQTGRMVSIISIKK